MHVSALSAVAVLGKAMQVHFLVVPCKSSEKLGLDNLDLIFGTRNTKYTFIPLKWHLS